MSNPIIHAIFDGQVFRPDAPVALPPNTRVTLALTSAERIQDEGERETSVVKEEPASFLDVARSMDLKGPPYWSRNLHDYLHGGKKFPDE